jgi:DNA-binding MarR family transcriptional regulator
MPAKPQPRRIPGALNIGCLPDAPGSLLRIRSILLRICALQGVRLGGAARRSHTGAVTRDRAEHRRISFLFDLFALGNRARGLLGQTMADAGLRPDEYAMYSAVLKAGPLTISELARMVGMPLTTVSDYVRSMTNRGHARRSRNPADSRSYLVSLTEDGVVAHRAARVSFADTINRIRKALAIPEQDLVRALRALDDAVRQVGEEPPGEDRRQQPAAGGRT